jgi:hypothetical protein
LIAERAPVLIFDDVTSEQIEVDVRGAAKDVLRRLAQRQLAGLRNVIDREEAYADP